MQLDQSPTYRRLLSERLRQEAQSKNNGTIPGGLASMIDQGMAGWLGHRDQRDRQAAQEAFNRALQSGDMGAGAAELGSMKGNEYAGRLSQSLAMQKMAQQQEAAAREAEFGQKLYLAQMNNDARIRAAKAGRSSVNVNNITGGVPNDALLETLGKKEADTWNAYLEAGDAAVPMRQDLDALSELAGQVPTGPIMGRLAENFPEFNNASAAFSSIVSRLAPRMRVPGSGATSDKEVEMFMQSLPRMRYSPEANRAIVQLLTAKAQIDANRARVVTAVANGEISPQEGRSAMRELNQKSVMPPALRQSLQGMSGDKPRGDTGNGIQSIDEPAPIDSLLQKYGVR